MPFFCVPNPGDLTAQQSQPLGICYPRQKMLMPGGKLRGGVEGEGGCVQLELTDALYWGIIPRGLVAREQPPLPSNKTGEMFVRGGRRLYTDWLF